MENPIKLLRLSLQMTQAEFGASIGVSGGRICQIERSSTERLGGDALEALATKYRVPIARLGLALEDFIRVAREQQTADGEAA